MEVDPFGRFLGHRPRHATGQHDLAHPRAVKEFASAIAGWDSLLGLILGIVALAAGLVLVGRGRTKNWLPSTWTALVVATAVVVVGGFGLQQYYRNHRYTASNLAPPFSWAQSISGSRIGVAGTFTQLQYALYGRNLSNYVQYIGVQGAHGSYAPVDDCSQWRALVNDGHYRYVVTSTGLVPRRSDVFTTPFSYTVWTGDDPASELIHRTIWDVTLPITRG